MKGVFILLLKPIYFFSRQDHHERNLPFRNSIRTPPLTPRTLVISISARVSAQLPGVQRGFEYYAIREKVPVMWSLREFYRLMACKLQSGCNPRCGYPSPYQA